MAKQTNKALLSNKLSSLALGGSAAAVILLPQAGYYKSGTAALHQGCAIYSADPALLHGRLRQLWRQLSWQLNHHRFFSNAR